MIRDDLGFKGLIVCDDLSMQALKGSVYERTKKAIGAGCDLVMHCNGTLEEQGEMYQAAPEIKSLALRRFQSSLDRIALKPEPSSIRLMRQNLEAALNINDEGKADPTEILARQKGLA
jgi:beta-N-acetylhexosaminidase